MEGEVCDDYVRKGAWTYSSLYLEQNLHSLIPFHGSSYFVDSRIHELDQFIKGSTVPLRDIDSFDEQI